MICSKYFDYKTDDSTTQITTSDTVEHKQITKVEQATAELYSSNKKLAHQLLEKKIISSEQLDILLGNIQMQLGQLLIQEKLIFKPELELALTEQQESNKKLGEILVEKNIISPYQLDRTLRKQ